MHQSPLLFSPGEWDFYFCVIQGHPGSIMLDLSLGAVAPVAAKPYLLEVVVALNDPNEFGLTQATEAETLYVMEDQLAEHLSLNLGALYAARSTTAGQRVFYFYGASRIDYDNIVAEVMEGFSAHRYVARLRPDPAWTVYRETLYPSELELQSILNRRGLEQLSAQGAGLPQAYKIEHLLLFPTERAREQFVHRIIPERFIALSQGHRDTTLRPYSLVIMREEQLDAPQLDRLVRYLMALAAACDGAYDGWRAAVVADGHWREE